MTSKSNKTPLSPLNLAIGAGVSIFEVQVPLLPASLSLPLYASDQPCVLLSYFPSARTTFGQPLEGEVKANSSSRLFCRSTLNAQTPRRLWLWHSFYDLVLKTHMASNRNDNLRTAVAKTFSRGGFKGFYQGLIPWVSFSLFLYSRRFLIVWKLMRKSEGQAWIESATTGGILLFTSSLIEDFATNNLGIGKGSAGLLGGMGGGAAQAYLAMGVCTTMKTAEITRNKNLPVALVSPIPGEPVPPYLKVPSTWVLSRLSPILTDVNNVRENWQIFGFYSFR